MLKKEDKNALQLTLTYVELEELLQKASQKGAGMALAEVGLADEHAGIDIRDLRELLKAFRIAKKDSFRIFIKWVVIGVMTLITAGFISLLGNYFK